MNPDLDMEGSIRELMGVAVAAQGSCQTCLYFHTVAALANGASESDVMATLTVALATRRLHGSIAEAEVEPMEFRQATDLVLWGDISTVEVRTLSADFCQRLVAASGDLAGFCEE